MHLMATRLQQTPMYVRKRSGPGQSRCQLSDFQLPMFGEDAGMQEMRILDWSDAAESRFVGMALC